MFGQTFYHSLLRKYVILTGTLFNDIYISRTDSDGNITQYIKVPVTYSAKDRMLARINQDPNIDRQSATVTLPCISFEMGQKRYAKDSKLNTIHRVVVKDTTNPSKLKYQYSCVPYDIEFKVRIWSKNAEDSTKILEQILPFFTPDWTTTVQLIPEIDEKRDIPIILDSVEHEDNYDGKFTDNRRVIMDTLNLTLKGYLYGPVKKSGVIKFVKVNFKIPPVPDGSIPSVVGNVPTAEQITAQPGLTANGQPTTNINDTIPYREINIDDDFGYIVQIHNENDIEE